MVLELNVAPFPLSNRVFNRLNKSASGLERNEYLGHSLEDKIMRESKFLGEILSFTERSPGIFTSVFKLNALLIPTRDDNSLPFFSCKTSFKIGINLSTANSVKKLLSIII